MVITLRAGVLRRVLFAMVVFLGAIDIAVQTVDHVAGPSFPGWVQVVKFFDLDREFAFPTWYSVMLLGASALLLGLIAWSARRAGDRMWRYWAALAVIFAGLSIDEQVLAHESVGQIVGEAIDSSGLLLYAWVIPGALAVALFGVLFIPFLRYLPADARRRMLLAGAIYVGGALVVEAISGVVADREGLDSFLYATVTSVEEIMEILGSSLFLLALVNEAGRRVGRAALAFECDTTPQRATAD